ncbi:MAG: hypothetical protein Q9188_001292 [Gyalolechia gomerana]
MERVEWHTQLGQGSWSASDAQIRPELFGLRVDEGARFETQQAETRQHVFQIREEFQQARGAGMVPSSLHEQVVKTIRKVRYWFMTTPTGDPSLTTPSLWITLKAMENASSLPGSVGRILAFIGSLCDGDGFDMVASSTDSSNVRNKDNLVIADHWCATTHVGPTGPPHLAFAVLVTMEDSGGAQMRLVAGGTRILVSLERYGEGQGGQRYRMRLEAYWLAESFTKTRGLSRV